LGDWRAYVENRAALKFKKNKMSAPRILTNEGGETSLDLTWWGVPIKK